MATEQIVTVPNLGGEFEIGTNVANKITIKVDGTTVLRDGITGELSSPSVAESLTTITYDNITNALVYTAEDGNLTTLDLSGLTTDVFVTGASLASGMLTLTDPDAGTPDVVVDLNDLLQVSSAGGNILTNHASDDKPFLDRGILETEFIGDAITDAFGVAIPSATGAVRAWV